MQKKTRRSNVLSQTSHNKENTNNKMNKNTSGPKDFARILAQEVELNKEQHPVEGVVTLDQAFPPERIWQSSSYYDNPIHDEEDREEASYSEDSNSSLRKSKHNKGLASKLSFGAISQILKLKTKKNGEFK